MAANSGKIIAKVIFDESINKEISASMETELRIAQNKWQINLDEDEKNLIRKLSLIQLAEKISDVFKCSFPEGLAPSSVTGAESIAIKGYENPEQAEDVILDFSQILVLIKSKFHDREVRVTIDAASEEKYEIVVTRTSAGYIVAEEESDKSVWLGDLPSTIHAFLHKWARTSIFYGVGSFK